MANYACIPYLITREFDDQGKLLAFGKVYTYQAGTTIPLQTYADAGGFATNLNPVVLDASGSANIFLKGQAYKFVFKDANDNLIRTIDNVLGSASASGGSMVVVSNYAALRALTTDFDVVVVLGRDTPDDGGYGVFEQVPFTADDDGIVLNRALVTSYRRQVEDYIDPRWFGVVYGISIAQNSAIVKAQNASDSFKVPVVYNKPVYLNSMTFSGGSIRFNQAAQFIGVTSAVISFVSCDLWFYDVHYRSAIFADNVTISGVFPANARLSCFANIVTWATLSCLGDKIIDDFTREYSGASLTISGNVRVEGGSVINLTHPAPSLTISGGFSSIPTSVWIYSPVAATYSFPIPARPEWFSSSDWSTALYKAFSTGRAELSRSYNITTPTTFPSAVVSSAIPSGFIGNGVVDGTNTFSGPKLNFSANCTFPNLTANGIEIYADANSRVIVSKLSAEDCFFNSPDLVTIPVAVTTEGTLTNCMIRATVGGSVVKVNTRNTAGTIVQTTSAQIDNLYLTRNCTLPVEWDTANVINGSSSAILVLNNLAGNISGTVGSSTALQSTVIKLIAAKKSNTVTLAGSFYDGNSTFSSLVLGGANSVSADLYLTTAAVFAATGATWFVIRGT